MIENDRQYSVTKDKLALLAESLSQIEQHPDPNLTKDVWESDVFSIRYLMGELKTEIAEYDALRTGQVSSLALPSLFDDLPGALTQARIARGWTQRDLANILGSSLRQVQKDERGGYAKATLGRLRRVAAVLGMRLIGEARLAIAETMPAVELPAGPHPR